MSNVVPTQNSPYTSFLNKMNDEIVYIDKFTIDINKLNYQRFLLFLVLNRKILLARNTNMGCYLNGIYIIIWLSKH